MKGKYDGFGTKGWHHERQLVKQGKGGRELDALWQRKGETAPSNGRNNVQRSHETVWDPTSDLGGSSNHDDKGVRRVSREEKGVNVQQGKKTAGRGVGKTGEGRHPQIENMPSRTF